MVQKYVELRDPNEITNVPIYNAQKRAAEENVIMQKAKAGYRREQYKNAIGTIKKGYEYARGQLPSRQAISKLTIPRAKGVKELKLPSRQAISKLTIPRAKGVKELKLSAVGRGFASAILGGEIIQPQKNSGSMQSYSAPQSSGRGRGRPTQSYTPKVLPSGQVVRMPVQAYKRAVSMQKAQMRMQMELAKARASMQPSPQEMGPQYAQMYDAEDKFLDTEDMASMPMQMGGEMPQVGSQAQGPASSGRRFSMGNLLSPFAPQQSQGQMQYAPPMSAGSFPTQRMSLWGNKMGDGRASNILNTPNVFNRPGETTIGVPPRRQYPYA